MRRSLATIVLCALLSACGTTFPALAQPNEPEAFRGIFCDTAEQIERVVVLGTEKGGAWEGIQAVNAEVKAATGKGVPACVFTTVLGRRGAALKTVDSPDGSLDLVPFFVTHVQHPALGAMIEREPVVWWTLAESKSRGA